MRFAFSILSSMIFACSTAGVPTSPNIVVVSNASFWVVVVDSTGACIPGASVQVVSGPGRGQTITQSSPCDASRPAHGMILNDLSPGVQSTLRASAPGYATQEKSVIPVEGSAGTVLFATVRIH
jgi:hypothetical protein